MRSALQVQSDQAYLKTTMLTVPMFNVLSVFALLLLAPPAFVQAGSLTLPKTTEGKNQHLYFGVEAE